MRALCNNTLIGPDQLRPVSDVGTTQSARTGLQYVLIGLGQPLTCSKAHTTSGLPQALCFSASLSARQGYGVSGAAGHCARDWAQDVGLWETVTRPLLQALPHLACYIGARVH